MSRHATAVRSVAESRACSRATFVSLIVLIGEERIAVKWQGGDQRGVLSANGRSFEVNVGEIGGIEAGISGSHRVIGLLSVCGGDDVSGN